MSGRGTPALVIALICFLVYFANVAIGGAGGTVFLSDVGEMLTLLAASIFFVIGVLLREAAAARDASKNDPKTNGSR